MSRRDDLRRLEEAKRRAESGTERKALEREIEKRKEKKR